MLKEIEVKAIQDAVLNKEVKSYIPKKKEKYQQG